MLSTRLRLSLARPSARSTRGCPSSLHEALAFTALSSSSTQEPAFSSACCSLHAAPPPRETTVNLSTDFPRLAILLTLHGFSPHNLRLCHDNSTIHLPRSRPLQNPRQDQAREPTLISRGSARTDQIPVLKPTRLPPNPLRASRQAQRATRRGSPSDRHLPHPSRPCSRRSQACSPKLVLAPAAPPSFLWAGSRRHDRYALSACRVPPRPRRILVANLPTSRVRSPVRLMLEYGRARRRPH